MKPGPEHNDYYCGFVTTCPVMKGEELVWDYGNLYNKVAYDQHQKITDRNSLSCCQLKY